MMSDRCHVPYETETNGSTSFSSEANMALAVTAEVAYNSTLSSFESPCCQILNGWIFDGSVQMNGSRTFGSDSYEA